MSLLSAQNVFLDQSSVENHRRLLDIALNNSVRNGHTHVTKQQCDAKFFGQLGLGLFTRLRLPLHFRTTAGVLFVQLDNLLNRVKESVKNPLKGKNTMKATTQRNYDLFCKNDRVLSLLPRANNEKDNVDNKYTSSVSRPNSVHPLLNSLEVGGSTRMMDGCSRNIILDRMSHQDSFVFGCVNMYLWLQKCIMAYTIDKCDVEASVMDVEILRFDADFLFDVAVDHDVVIDVDCISNDELMVLMIALAGHENVAILNSESDPVRAGREDIFSSILTAKSNYRLCTRKKRGGDFRVEFNVIAPELALKSIYSVCEKLGCLDDWLSVPDYVRGIATFNQLMMEVSDDKGGKEFIIDAAKDRSYGTLFGNICNPTLGNRADSTNLAASSICLILEVLTGQAYMNNLHYIAESLGLFNERIFSDDPSTQSLYNSVMVEMGIYTEVMHSTLIRAIFVQGNNTGLYGSVRFFRSLLESYVVKYHTDRGGCRNAIWLQINVIFGSVFDNNSSSMLGKTVPIDAMSIGPMVSDPKQMDKVCEFLMIHGLTREQIIAGGMSNVGGKPLYSVDPSIYSNTDTMNGLYCCGYSQVSLLSDARPRSGYETNQSDNLYQILSYFCFGQNRPTDGAYIPPAKRRDNGAKQSMLDLKKQENTEHTMEWSKKMIDAGERLKKKKGFTESHSLSDNRDRSGKVRFGTDRTYSSLTDALTAKEAVRKTLDSSSLYGIQKSRELAESEASIQPIKNAPVPGRIKDLANGKIPSDDDGWGELSEDRGVSTYEDEMSENATRRGLRPDGQRIMDPDEPGYVPMVCDAGIEEMGFKLYESTADGACASHTLDNYHHHMPNTNSDEYARCKEDTGFGSTKEWQAPGTIEAVNQMLGHRTVVINKDTGDVRVTKIQKPRGTCFVLYRNNHYELLNPDNPDSALEDLHLNFGVRPGYFNYVTDDIDPQVARVYAEWLAHSGIAVTVERKNSDPGMRYIKVDEKRTKKKLGATLPRNHIFNRSYREGPMEMDILERLKTRPEWSSAYWDSRIVHELRELEVLPEVLNILNSSSPFPPEVVDQVAALAKRLEDEGMPTGK